MLFSQDTFLSAFDRWYKVAQEIPAGLSKTARAKIDAARNTARNQAATMMAQAFLLGWTPAYVRAVIKQHRPTANLSRRGNLTEPYNILTKYTNGAQVAQEWAAGNFTKGHEVETLRLEVKPTDYDGRIESAVKSALENGRTVEDVRKAVGKAVREYRAESEKDAEKAEKVA